MISRYLGWLFVAGVAVGAEPSRFLIKDYGAPADGRILNVAPWKQFFDLKGYPSPARMVNQVSIKNVKGNFGSMGALAGNENDVLKNITLENFAVRLRQIGIPERRLCKSRLKSKAEKKNRLTLGGDV